MSDALPEGEHRSRNCRFLGSIGWFDTVHVELDAGGSELVLAVSETFGRCGV